MPKYLALDSETNGVDFKHGSKPFFVTTCTEDGVVEYWEWSVDPITREPQISEENIVEIRGLIENEGYELVLHNGKFDIAALKTIIPDLKWPWHRTHDTLILSHLLASNQPHNLTDLAMHYLGYDIEPAEKELEKWVKKARDYCRRHLEEWSIAKEGSPSMPSVTKETWRADYWLPRALAPYHPDSIKDLDHPFHTVLREYANHDAPATLGIFKVMWGEVQRRDLEKIYRERMKVVKVLYDMQQYGMTGSREQLEKQLCIYEEESETCTAICENIAEDMGYELKLPAGTRNDNLKTFIFDVMQLPVVGKTNSGNPSMKEDDFEQWMLMLEQGSKKHTFVDTLIQKRKRDSAITKIHTYERFALPFEDCDLAPLPCQPCDKSKAYSKFFRLHPNVNPTGTHTLRMSSSNPSGQTISKQEGFNIREAFGPGPGREWFSADAQNIELRIPAFEAQEEELMRVFLHPKDPPYFGSYHLAIFDLLHPELFKLHGKNCKTLFESTWYQWIKNGNFAILYGGGRRKVDATFRVLGAYDMIWSRFSKFSTLNQKQISDARKYGWVTTIPDKSVDPTKGYPIMVETYRGEPDPTKPLNYHTQSTACWWMMKAMIRVHEFLTALNDGEVFKKKKWRDGYHITMQIHDELVLDFPSGKGRGKNDWDYNLPVMMEVKRLMELGGTDISVPTPVAVEYNPINWATGIAL